MNKIDRLQMEIASLRYLEDGKQEIFELFIRTRDNLDGSDYMQGKKDALRQALALLGINFARQPE